MTICVHYWSDLACLKLCYESTISTMHLILLFLYHLYVSTSTTIIFLYLFFQIASALVNKYHLWNHFLLPSLSFLFSCIFIMCSLVQFPPRYPLISSIGLRVPVFFSLGLQCSSLPVRHPTKFSPVCTIFCKKSCIVQFPFLALFQKTA